MAESYGQDLMAKLLDMHKRQSEGWKLLQDNYDTYINVSRKELLFSKFTWLSSVVELNYRKKSLTADLKAISEGKRACFLCKDSRPLEQESIEWKDYVILCNPYPASDIHFTIVNREHTPQQLGKSISNMVELARRLPQCTIFYNGPRCGASAPDHAHFQAVSLIESINFSHKIQFFHRLESCYNKGVYIPTDSLSPYGYYLIEINEGNDILPIYEAVISTLPCEDGNEPMMNVVTFYAEGKVRVVIVPRRKHRPVCYGRGEGQMLVSPASLEIMGKSIVSNHDDFNSLNRERIFDIYREVCYTHDEFSTFVKRLSK